MSTMSIGLQISLEILSQCHFNYMEQSLPVPLKQLGTEQRLDWKGYMASCMTSLLKESRERLIEFFFVYMFILGYIQK